MGEGDTRVTRKRGMFRRLLVAALVVGGTSIAAAGDIATFVNLGFSSDADTAAATGAVALVIAPPPLPRPGTPPAASPLLRRRRVRTPT